MLPLLRQRRMATVDVTGESESRAALNGLMAVLECVQMTGDPYTKIS